MNTFRTGISQRTATLIMILCVAAPARSATIIDQFYSPAPVDTLAEVDETIDHAQTFTVGAGGILTGVDVLICKGFNTTQDLLFDVRKTVGGVPAESDDLGSNAVLANIRVPSIRVKIHDVQFVHIDIGEFKVEVSPGDVLALVLRPSEPFVQGDDDGYAWGGNRNDDQYTLGTRYSRSILDGPAWGSFPTRDMGFVTYVDNGSAVPEPASVTMMGAGVSALLGYACYRGKQKKT